MLRPPPVGGEASGLDRSGAVNTAQTRSRRTGQILPPTHVGVRMTLAAPDHGSAAFPWPEMPHATSKDVGNDKGVSPREEDGHSTTPSPEGAAGVPAAPSGLGLFLSTATGGLAPPAISRRPLRGL